MTETGVGWDGDGMKWCMVMLYCGMWLCVCVETVWGGEGVLYE